MIPQGKIHFTQDIAKSEVGRQIKTFFKELEDTGTKKFGNCTRLQNPISSVSSPGQGTSQSKNEYRSIHISESKNRKHVAERCHYESVTYFRRVFKQPISGRQMRWRKETSDKPENLNLFIPYQHFKMEGLHLIKGLFQDADYMYKIDLRDAYFTITTNQKDRKYLRFKWEGTLYEFLYFSGLVLASLIYIIMKFLFLYCGT